MGNNNSFGVVPPLMVPALSHEWSFVSGPHVIDLPFLISLEGGTDNLSSVGFGEDGEADFVDLGSITKMLFQESLYPKLEVDEVFVLGGILINKEEGIISLIGNILKKHS